jgi:hypothetical protein
MEGMRRRALSSSTKRVALLWANATAVLDAVSTYLSRCYVFKLTSIWERRIGGGVDGWENAVEERNPTITSPAAQ